MAVLGRDRDALSRRLRSCIHMASASPTSAANLRRPLCGRCWQPSDPDTIGRSRSYFRQARHVAHRPVCAGIRPKALPPVCEPAKPSSRRRERKSVGLSSTADAFRIEVGEASPHMAALTNELAATRADVARQIETIARLEQELSASRAETARQAEAVRAFQQQCAGATSDSMRFVAF